MYKVPSSSFTCSSASACLWFFSDDGIQDMCSSSRFSWKRRAMSREGKKRDWVPSKDLQGLLKRWLSFVPERQGVS